MLKKFNSPKKCCALTIATFFGVGLIPLAPGTYGSLAALPLVYFTAQVPLVLRICLWSFICILGIWAARVYDETLDSKDNNSIVIDEVIGVAIASWAAGTNLYHYILAFILFRIFDILKPPPVRQLDQWSHKKSKPNGSIFSPWQSSIGVIGDDVLAGLLAFLVIFLLQFFEVLKL